MARRPTMNHDRDVIGDNNDSPKKSFYNPVIYKPLPDKAGLEATNKLFISLMAPYRWSLFNPTPEMVGLHDMVGSGNQLVSVPNDLLTYSFKLPVHYSMGNGFVICPVALNKYLTEVHGYGQLFNSPRCAHCEKSNEAWSVYNQRWVDLGYDKDRLKNLGREEYRHLRDNDPVLKTAYADARKFSPQNKYVLQVWDHDKFTGNRPMDAEQEQLSFQLFLAPESIHRTLQDLFRDDIEFYDATSELGVQVMNLTKDTKKCSGNNLSQTTYSLTPSKTVKYPADWVAFMDNEETWPDVLSVVNLASYDEMKRSLLSAQADESIRSSAPVAAPPSAPKAAPKPPVAPPTTAPTPPIVPVAPPVAAPVPSAPVLSAPMPPVAAPTPPVAPSAPVPVPPASAPPMPNFGTAPMAPGMMPDRSGTPGKRHNW